MTRTSMTRLRFNLWLARHAGIQNLRRLIVFGTYKLLDR